MRRKTGCDDFESAPPRERVRPWYFNLRFKTENSKERFSMHQCFTKALAVVAASAMTFLPVCPASAEDKDGSSTKTPIKHVVVIFQENVSFDHYFGTYPHAKENNDGSKYFKGATCVEDHSYSDEQFAFDGGLMDRFAKVSCNDPNIGPFSTMGYYDGNTATALWNYAQHFAMSDNSFGTTFGPSTPGLLNLVAGNTFEGTIMNGKSGQGNIAGGRDAGAVMA